MSASLTHHHSTVNGIAMHWVEQGVGDPVVLCHGFPHTWYSWHRQIGALANAGWRVIVPDLRGMGQSEAPADPQAYDCHSTAGDLAGLLDHLGLASAVFVGLDFGIFAIFDLAHLHPERVRAMIALENPHYPDRPDKTPLEEADEWARDHFVHIHDFVRRADSHAEPDAQPREFLARVYHALSAEGDYFQTWKHPSDATYMEALPPTPPLPWKWLSGEELDTIADDYARSGFAGGINWYRAMDIRWHQRATWRGQKTTQPFYFIGSEHDVDLEAWHGDDPINAIPDHHADPRKIAMVKGAGHMMHLERSDEVTAILRQFLDDIR